MNIDSRPISGRKESHFSIDLLMVPVYRAVYMIILQLELFFVFSMTVKYKINGGAVSALFGTSVIFTLLINKFKAYCD